MCIAVFKPAGTKAPTLQTLKECFVRNPDGAGFMVAIDNKVIIRKGFMTWKDFKNGLNDFFRNLNDTDFSIVYHFRISTQGGTQPSLTHPFALSQDYEQMRSLEQVCDMGVAHNGIIRLTSDSSVHDRNDTMTFIHDYLFDLVDKNTHWGKNAAKIRLVKKLISGYPNKLAVLNANGYCTLIGDWIKDGGVYYSNTSYKTYTSHTRAFNCSSTSDRKHFTTLTDLYKDCGWVA